MSENKQIALFLTGCAVFTLTVLALSGSWPSLAGEPEPPADVRWIGADTLAVCTLVQTKPDGRELYLAPWVDAEARSYMREVGYTKRVEDAAPRPYSDEMAMMCRQYVKP